MPSWASSKRPGRSAVAPVKAPLRVTEQLALEQLLGMAAQLIAVKPRSGRGLMRWIARASTSLPVPLSPVISTVVVWRATRLASSSRSRMARLSATTRSRTTSAPRRGAERLDLAAELLPLLGLPDGHGDFVGAERLVEVVVRAFAHGGERASSVP